ncbi:MAG TPA: hypothetical protein VHT29_04090 [Solirubrobacteraceae bacterium]|nr:hypothetical protein [Solirubrobacteraceae bacterium]
MNDATRLLGGTLGVAVIGSVYASVLLLPAQPIVADGQFPSGQRLTSRRQALMVRRRHEAWTIPREDVEGQRGWWAG